MCPMDSSPIKGSNREFSVCLISNSISLEWLICVFRLDLSHNSLSKIPIMSLTNLAALTLCELDLSFNSIAAIHSMDLSNKFRVNSVDFILLLTRFTRCLMFLLVIVISEFGQQPLVPFGRRCIRNITTFITSRFIE